MFNTLSQHSVAYEAAFAFLEDPVVSDSSSKTVSGEYLGLHVTFLGKYNGWEIRVQGVETSPSMEVLLTRDKATNGEFSELYDLDSTPGSFDEIRISDFHDRILKVRPNRIFMSQGRLVLRKVYALCVAEPDQIREAIHLSVDLLIAAQRESKPRALSLASGAPYRQDMLSLVKSKDFELAKFHKRLRARRNVHALKLALTLALVVVWPVGLFVWAWKRRQRS